MDWDEDGKKDLVVGDTNGYIHIFRNTGTDANPSFSGSALLEVGSAAFDCGDRATPEIVDWDNDGKKDVLCGDDAGRISLLINTGTNASPSFSTREYLYDGGSILDVGTGTDRSNPVVVDWDGDGKKDLLSGRYNGNVVFYKNNGTDANPYFSGKTVLQAGGSTITAGAGYYSRIEVYDWNNDGGLDLLVGNEDLADGRVSLYLAQVPPQFAKVQQFQVTSKLIIQEPWGFCIHNYTTGGSIFNRGIIVGGGPVYVRAPYDQWIGVFIYSYHFNRWEEACWILKVDW